MTPSEFVEKWKANVRPERASSQEHFIDLCRLLGEPTPNEADPSGAAYAFERGASKTTGGEGWADVWKRAHFGWEYKGKRKDLTAAFAQLQGYALALENPPLLVVSDIETTIIRTNWTNAVSETITVRLDDLLHEKARRVLKAVMSDPEALRPGLTRAALTAGAAARFAELAARLRQRGHDPHAVAHLVNRLVFVMFADDVGLLPRGLVEKMLVVARRDPSQFEGLASDLFRAMKDPGGRVGFDAVPWFNGGLFADTDTLPLDGMDVTLLQEVAALDWGEIDPSILGTLFERGLDPDKRGELGAHYTSREMIGLVVEPVVVRPLVAEWEAAKVSIAAAVGRAEAARKAGRTSAATKTTAQAKGLLTAFLDRLRAVRVLDPACGSGNFLYLSLLALKDLEHRVSLEAEAMGLQREFPVIGPEVVHGIEINPYAAELARVSVWIGAIQWARRNGMPHPDNPILKPLDNIECRNAVLDDAGSPAPWPEAEFVVGNPPFIGGKMMRRQLGDAAVDTLFRAYRGRVPPEADFVTYWFERAREEVEAGRARGIGFVATNSIRGGASRKVLERVAENGRMHEAWSDEPWVLDGAAVRVSIVCWERSDGTSALRLDGTAVSRINADLTATASDLTRAARLPANAGVAFMGMTPAGPFPVPGDVARMWLAEPANPGNGRPNGDVLVPYVNAMDLTRRSSDRWIIDFGATRTETEATGYIMPFAHVLKEVKPGRQKNAREGYRRFWWRFAEARPALRAALAPLRRYIATPRVAKHRLFVWLPTSTMSDSQIIVVARDDDTTFGILHSRWHEAWALRLGTFLGVGNDPRYTPSTTFETFPFPEGLTPDTTAASYATDPRALRIAVAARALVAARDRWLNPPELVREVPEAVAGLPPRLIPVDAKAEEVLKRRTLTNLYNTRGTPEGRWLDDLHAALDAAVAAAYGWPSDVPVEEALSKLLALNTMRVGGKAPFIGASAPAEEGEPA